MVHIVLRQVSAVILHGLEEKGGRKTYLRRDQTLRSRKGWARAGLEAVTLR